MGLISDLLTSPESIDTDPNTNTLDAVVIRELNEILEQGDFDLGTDFQEKDEVQSLATYSGTVSGGTFTLTFTLKNGETFTTGNIAFDADAATIESAIDTAATSASITGWTNGDITVAGGDLNTNPVTFTYDGDSVSGLNHSALTVDDANLTGGGSAGAVTTTTEGQTVRRAYALLYALGAVSGTVPAQGDDPSGLSAPTNRATNPNLPREATLRALAREAAIVDENETVETVLLETMGLAKC